MPTKPTSAAAARRAARKTTTPAPAVSDAVAARIEQYASKVIDPAVWETIRPLVKTVVSASVPTSPDRAQHLMLAAAKFVTWTHQQGLPLDRDRLFTSVLVDEWANQRLATGDPKKSVATDRTLLRVLLPESETATVRIGRGTGP